MKVVFGDVAVVVGDADASAAWWKKLGFEVRDSAGHWVTVAPPGANVVLHLCQGPPRESGNTGIGFYVDDVAEVEKTWSGLGVTFSQPRTETPAAVMAKFLDPDGNEFWLFEDEDLRKAPRKAAPRKAVKKAGAKRGGKAAKGAPRKVEGKRAAKKTAKKARR